VCYCRPSQRLTAFQIFHIKLLIDETTDVTQNKIFTILVKYLDEDETVIKTKLFELRDVYDENNNLVRLTGEALYDLIKSTLIFHMITLENLVGFAADTAGNMFGKNNSVFSRLDEEFPGISWVEDLVKNVYSYFSHSAKRRFEYETFQHMFDIDPTRLLS